MGVIFSKDIAMLDVTSRLITAVVGAVNVRSAFHVKASSQAQYQGYSDGKFFDASDAVAAAEKTLKEAMTKSASKAKKLYISVPGEFAACVTRESTLSFDRKKRVTDADVDELIEKNNTFNDRNFAVINKAAVYFAIDGRERLYSDVRGLVAGKVEAGVSYILADRYFLDIMDKVGADLGFSDVRYVSSEWAQCMTLLDDKQRESVFMLVDVGYLSSSITVAKGDGILDMRSFSMGGGHISGDICRYLNVPFDMAEDARRLVDINRAYKPDEDLVADSDYEINACYASEIVKARLDMFAKLIRVALDDMRVGDRGYMPIYLTGEGISLMRGAKKYIAEKLGRDMEILCPTLPNYPKPSDSTVAALIGISAALSGQDGLLGRLIK